MMNVLVTGGAGYIGSHTCLELIRSGHQISVVDNLCNSSQESLRRVEKLTRVEIPFFQLDLLDQPELEKVVAANSFDAVIHFAALKSVGESVTRPLEYYRNNITGTTNLCEVVVNHNIPHFVFSSSATVYGLPKTLPLNEDSPTLIHETTNPYGRSKLMMEFVLRDLHVACPQMNIALLRYFNPVGAHESGEIGEDPTGLPNNLFPYVSQVAVGKLRSLSIYGNDYDTPDGTGIRDYIHVVDLAVGHVLALKKLESRPGIVTYNLGTGKGYSVLEIVSAFEKVSGKKVPYQIGARRPGDIASCYADPALALHDLGWKATRGLDEMCADSWRWQSQNPNGYATGFPKL